MIAKYIHIPKTAGTCLKNIKPEDLQKLDFEIDVNQRGHVPSLLNSHGCQFVFCVRDPWQRFASAFYSRKTVNLRHEYLLKLRETQSVRDWGYHLLTGADEQFFKKYSTPNDVISDWRNNAHFEYPTTDRPPIWEMLASITKWTGTMDEYQNLEVRVKWVFGTDNLDSIMQNKYGIEMPKDRFNRRSNELFENETIDYSISDENLAWFKNFRARDYKLIDYIRQQPYYVDK